MNKVILIGRLAQDPEPRYTPKGVPVTRFPLAVNRPFTNQHGEREADFINIVTWNRLAEVTANNLQKGRKIAVEGMLTVRSYTDKEGVRRKTAEVVARSIEFLDYPKDDENVNGSIAENEPDFNDEDVPF
ncbi:single-strand DNA-binding protein [Desulfohalotomaculum tongense]|uniref:single-stranded DNA-binding protein n=1 Tax=Desulforadius tongensis TaxID=1216062 RepID=UPI00195D8D3C|nr:single-strand DNA-binding protein [Desulforadius tongensis]